MNIFPARPATLVVLCLVFAGAARGAEGTITLEQAVARSLEQSPALIAAGYQIEASEALILQAGLRPNPEVSLLVENALGTGPFSGIDATETTLSIGWLLERGKREQRVTAARANVALTEAAVATQRRDVAADTARSFVDSLAMQNRLAQLQAAVDLAEVAVAAVAERVRVGGSPRADLARAEAELARTRLDLDDARHEQQVAYRRLAARWGETRPSFERVHGNLERVPEPTTFDALLAQLDTSPYLRETLTEQRLREAELRLAQSEARPSWRVSAGLRRHELGDDVALLAGVTIPIALNDRNEGNIARARARLTASGAERDALRVRLETQLFGLQQQLLHALHQAEVLETDVLPRIEAALADTRQAYALGRYRYFELRLVQAELLDARFALIEAQASAHRNVIEIERLTGASLAAATNAKRESS